MSMKPDVMKPGSLADRIGQRKPPLSQPSEQNTKKDDKNGQTEQELDCRANITRYVEMHIFDVVIGIVIFMNAISIGIEQSLQVAGHDTLVCQIIESIFLVIYICELSARFVAYGVACFQDHWVKFDAFLVTIGIICSWVIEPFVDASPDELGLLMVLRVLRLLRLLKTARLFSQIQEFLRLIKTILDSTTIVLCAVSLVFIILYVFSSLGVELITKHKLATGKNPDQLFQDQVDKYFRNLPLTMLTLMQFVTLDDMSSVYKPLIEKDPWLSLYFILLIVFLSIVLMNLVAAVIFSCILQQEQTERDGIQRGQEEEWAKLIRDLKEIFTTADSDGSGQLSKDEIMSMDEEDMNKLKQALGVNTPLQIFNSLDVDGSGELNINEFFDGIWDCVLAKGSADLKRLEKQVEAMYWRLKETFGMQYEIRSAVDNVHRKLEFALEDDKLSKNSLSRNSLPYPMTAVGTPPARVTSTTNGLLESMGREADASGVPSEKSAIVKAANSAREPNHSARHHTKPKKARSPLSRSKEVDQEKQSAASKASPNSPAQTKRDNKDTVSIANELRCAATNVTPAVSSAKKLHDTRTTEALPEPVGLTDPAIMITPRDDSGSELPAANETAKLKLPLKETDDDHVPCEHLDTASQEDLASSAPRIVALGA